MTLDEENDDAAESEGGMAEHLQRYKNYIDNLKQGKSSGISSIFGRASDLLPPEVLEIRPPRSEQQRQAVNPREAKPSVSDNSYIEAVEDLSGEESEDVHDQESEVGDDNAPDSGFEDTDNAVYDEEESDDDLNDDSEDSDDDSDDDEDSYDELNDVEENSDEDIEDSDNEDIEHTNELRVTSANGAFLWKILFNRAEPVLVSMSDGTTIRPAEGRDDSVLALKHGNSFKFFILSGLVIDPSTGNIYVEANDGAYTAAFLNNGWQIHQYRTHEGEETYYATEPFKPGRPRATMQIMNLGLNPVTGEVSYDSLDGSATMTLKSRRI